MKFNLSFYAFFLIILLHTSHVFAVIYKVGPTRTYTVPSQVASLLNNGDTVDIDVGEYIDCASWSANNILIRGVGGFAHLKDKSCGGKGIMIITGDNVTVENIEFSGATVPDANGAGIRAQGGSITVRHCYFHNNENGILGAPTLPNAHFLVEYSEFANNGAGGGGYAHNMYIGNFDSFTLQFSYTHDAIDGHEVKSRAKKNYILFNRITEEDGTSSRNIDLPNGGPAYIIGNIIEQGKKSANSNIFGYGLEGLSSPEPHNVYVVNNTFVNDLGRGSFIDPTPTTNLLKVTNNIFAGTGTTITTLVTTLDSSSNWVSPDISSVKFVNSDSYDYGLTASSPVINKGIDPGFADKYPLMPLAEYVHPVKEKERINDGKIDIGAYEYTIVTEIQPSLIESTPQCIIYPNPLSNVATISFSLNQKENISVELLDILGSKLATIFQGTVEAGKQEIKWNTDHLFPGIYLLNFETADQKLIRRISK